MGLVRGLPPYKRHREGYQAPKAIETLLTAKPEQFSGRTAKLKFRNIGQAAADLALLFLADKYGDKSAAAELLTSMGEMEVRFIQYESGSREPSGWERAPDKDECYFQMSIDADTIQFQRHCAPTGDIGELHHESSVEIAVICENWHDYVDENKDYWEI